LIFARSSFVGSTLRARNLLFAFDCQQLIRAPLRVHFPALVDRPELDDPIRIKGCLPGKYALLIDT
jgi:hypothetical protein